MKTIITIWVLSFVLLVISAENAGCVMWLSLVAFALTSIQIKKKTKEVYYD